MKRLVLVIISLIVVLPGFAQLENPAIRRGNRFYKKHKYPQAETQYRMALKKNPSSFVAKNNLGLALYRENNDTTALSVLMPLLQQKSERLYMSQAAYNLSDVFVKLAADSLQVHNNNGAIRNLEQASRALRQSIKLNPDDYQARYNLWVVQKLLDSLKQQQRNRGGQNQKQQQKQNNQQNQQNQNQKQQQKQNSQQNQKQQKQNQQQNQRQKQQRQFKGMNPQEIERMLKAVEQQDRRVQQKAMRRLMQHRQHKKTDKNW